MKKTLLFAVLPFLLLTKLSATIHDVQVSNFQFTPATVNAFVGDTVRWTLENGTHTTTSRTIPEGAAPWDSPIDPSNTTFDYVITEEGEYNYWCTPHAPDMAGVINASAALPVVLSEFNVSLSNNTGILNWKTLTEINTDYFSVKRSVDGSKFTDIGKVNAAGNSVFSKTYSFQDNNINKETKYYYYMLEIIDKDGKRQASDIKMLRNNTISNTLITRLSPNPISRPGHLMLQFNADKQGMMLVQLYDSKGNMVKQTRMTAVEGLNNGHFHLGDLPSGMYKIVFSLEGLKETKSIIVQ
jgi:plastocyanin